MKRLLFLVVACTIFGGCDDQTPKIEHPETRTDRKEVRQLQKEGTEVLTIGPNSFRLEAYLWRDFMPMGGISEDDAINGRSLISINWLVEVNGMTIPDNIDLVKQYVVYGDQIWEAEYQDEVGPEQPPFKIEKISRKGPKWGPHITVNVIAEVRDSKTEKSYYIKLENVYVERTD